MLRQELHCELLGVNGIIESMTEKNVEVVLNVLQMHLHMRKVELNTAFAYLQLLDEGDDYYATH